MPPVSYIVALGRPCLRLDHHRAGLRARRRPLRFRDARRPGPGRVHSQRSAPVVRPDPGRAVDDRQAPGAERVPTIFSVRFFEADELVAALLDPGHGRQAGHLAAGGTITTVSFSSDEPTCGARSSNWRDCTACGGGVLRPAAASQRRGCPSDGRPGGEQPSRVRPSRPGRGGWRGGYRAGHRQRNHDSPGLRRADRRHPELARRPRLVERGDQSRSETTAQPTLIRATARTLTGSVCGNGSASLAVQPEPVRGLAFEGNLVFQAIEQRLQWTDAYRQAYYRQYRRYPPTPAWLGCRSI